MTTVVNKELTDKELNAVSRPTVKASGKVHIILLRPLFTVKATDGTPHTKYGIVSELQVDPTNTKTPNTFYFKGGMYELMIEEYALFDKMGLGIVYYDILGRKPIKVSIDDIENQKSSKFAENMWGRGHTLSNLIASIEDKKKGSALIYITMIIIGLFGGIIIDHFAHI